MTRQPILFKLDTRLLWYQEAARFPDWGKMEFHKFPPKRWQKILPDASEDARDLVSKLLRYQSSDRLNAAAVRDIYLFCERYADILQGVEPSVL